MRQREMWAFTFSPNIDATKGFLVIRQVMLVPIMNSSLEVLSVFA
jgi:hypothetical protein